MMKTTIQKMRTERKITRTERKINENKKEDNENRKEDEDLDVDKVVYLVNNDQEGEDDNKDGDSDSDETSHETTPPLNITPQSQNMYESHLHSTPRHINKSSHNCITS